MDIDSSDLSSAQYAHRNKICLKYYFIDDNDYKKSEPVYHKFIRGKNEGKKIEVGRRFDEPIFSLDCFPRKYKEMPSKATLMKMLSTVSCNLGFLNKEIKDEILLSYIFRVLEKKYYMYGYSIDMDYFKKPIRIGKSKELEEMNFSTRRYMWHKEYQNLNKKIKISIMARDRFKQTVTKNTNIIFDAVTELLENYDDFISNKLVSKITGIPQHTVSRYIHVHQKEISAHNKQRYQTDDYNKYTMEVNKGNIINYIEKQKLSNKKLSIKEIAKELKLHRNTVSKIVNKHNLF